MSEDESNPLNRPIPGKKGAVAILGVLWLLLSVFVLSRSRVAGAVMLGGYVLVAFVIFYRDFRSRTPDQKAELVNSIKELEKHPLNRFLEFLKWVAIVFVVLYAIFTFAYQ